MLPVLTPTDFIALANQTLEFAYPSITIEAEIKNLKISRGKWLYFDLTDSISKVRCFGTVYNLPGPIEDGMVLRVAGHPRLHEQFGFSFNIRTIELSGEGTIKKAGDLLRLKLEKEGIFAVERKRALPYPPSKIALITSEESAAYRDFIKVLSNRFGAVDIDLANVKVQGTSSVSEIVKAIEWFNAQPSLADVIVIIRGGGSSDDLQAFSSEVVVRAVSTSRIPTLVAIGHEVDIALAELAADVRASTPSNAAEILVPDRKELIIFLKRQISLLHQSSKQSILNYEDDISTAVSALHEKVNEFISRSNELVDYKRGIIENMSPKKVLNMGYSIVRSDDKIVINRADVSKGDSLNIELSDGSITAEVRSV